MKIKVIQFFLFIFLATSINAFGGLPESNEKYQVMREVFDNLVRATGDGRPEPSLVVISAKKSPGFIAEFNSGKETLSIGEALYDMLAAQNNIELEDGLAVIVGHELAHYYKDHGWGGDFGRSFVDDEVGNQISQIDMSVDDIFKLETEADYAGGIYGYVAGYNVIDTAPAVLKLVYSSYGLPDKMPGYPSKDDRIQIAHTSGKKLEKLIPVFKAANNLMLIGQNEDAARLFAFIARAFPSREIYNNMGVAYLLEALKLSKTAFIYPVEMDSNTRLNVKRLSMITRKGYASKADEKKHKLLEKALKAFETAKSLDKDYATALVNIAATYDLQGDHDMAAVFAKKAYKLAKSIGDTVTASNAIIMRGIANGQNAEIKTAKSDFKKGEAGNKELALLNASVLEPNSTRGLVNSSTVSKEKFSKKKEKIGSMSLIDLDDFEFTQDEVVTELPKISRTERALNVYHHDGGDWETLFIAGSFADVSMLVTSQSYKGKSGRGIKVGDNISEVKKKYGEPAKYVASQQGTYYVYELSGIVFQADEKNFVSQWMIYEEIE